MEYDSTKYYFNDDTNPGFLQWYYVDRSKQKALFSALYGCSPIRLQHGYGQRGKNIMHESMWRKIVHILLSRNLESKLTYMLGNMYAAIYVRTN